MNIDKKFNKNYRFFLEIEYLNYLIKNDICQIPDSLIRNITNNFNDNMNDNVINFIKSKLPTNLSPYVTLGVTDNVMEKIYCINYINSNIDCYNKNIKEFCFRIKKYLDNFTENNLFKNNILENIFNIEINVLTSIKCIDYKLEITDFYKYVTKNKPFDFYDFLKKYNIKYNEKVGDSDVYSFLLMMSFLLTKINILITNLYNFNIIVNKNNNTFEFNRIKVFFLTLKQNFIELINNLDYESFIFCPNYLDEFNDYILKFIKIVQQNNDTDLIKSLKQIFCVNNITIDKNIFLNKNIDEVKEFVYNLSIDNKVKEYISQNIFKDSEKTIHKINQKNIIKNSNKISRLGLWNNFWSSRINRKSKECIIINYCKQLIIKNNITSMEEWGCGQAKIKSLIPNIKYLGIDGSNTGYQNKIYDLVEYKSNIECIFMKHVLEHNVEWKKILENLIESFQKLCIIVIHTPYQDTTKVLGYSLNEINKYGYNINLEKIGFSKSDLSNIFNKYKIKYEFLTIDKNENIIILQK